MDAKICVLIICTVQYVSGAGLLRTPKVYNAVITTDENLTPSRAFPVIQPTIHETGIASFPFGGFHPYRFISPPQQQFIHSGEGFVRNALPLPYGSNPNEQIPYYPPPNQIPETGPGPLDLPATNQTPPRAPEGDIRPPFPLPYPPQNNENAPIPPEDRPPIPLNEFGLPPSLVPIQSFQRPQKPINLQPYPYNNYPLIYDSYNHFPEHYLPPFGYYPPPSGFGINPPQPPNRGPNQQGPPQATQQGRPETLKDPQQAPQQNDDTTPSPDSLKVQPKQETVTFDRIKNASNNRNSEVPDVPPPPLPTGGRKTA